MAYIVMAYIVMAYIVMAYIVMAFMVMPQGLQRCNMRHGHVCADIN